MTTVVGESARPATGGRGQPLALCAAVAVAVVAGWLAYDRWLFPRLDAHLLGWGVVREHAWLADLTFVLLGYLPYAAVLLLWGRTPARRVGGALVVLVAAGYVWGLYQVFSTWVWGDTVSVTSRRVYTWAAVLVVPVLCALAWGVARRWGARWPAGLLVAPVVAALLRELGLRSGWWRSHVLGLPGEHWLAQRAVLLLPIVAAGVACWLLDVAETRRSPGRGTSA